MSEIRVLIVDDQRMARLGIRQIVQSDPLLLVTGEAGDGIEAVELVASSMPDVVLMDIRMPRMDGIEATRQIMLGKHRPRVIMLTTFDNDDYVFGALEAGAAGFLLKDVSPDDLVRAIHTVAAGDALVSPSVTQRLVVAALSGRRPSKETSSVDIRVKQLSERERDVLVAMAEGLSNAQIAAKLCVGEATVKTHVSSVLLKLGLESRVQAVIFAYRNGLSAL